MALSDLIHFAATKTLERREKLIELSRDIRSSPRINFLYRVRLVDALGKLFGICLGKVES